MEIQMTGKRAFDVAKVIADVYDMDVRDIRRVAIVVQAPGKLMPAGVIKDADGDFGTMYPSQVANFLLDTLTSLTIEAIIDTEMEGETIPDDISGLS